MLAIAFPAISLGALAIILKKESSSSDHITTWHAVRHYLMVDINRSNMAIDFWHNCCALNVQPDAVWWWVRVVRRRCIRWKCKSQSAVEIS
jgi:hypothetical protein